LKKTEPAAKDAKNLWSKCSNCDQILYAKDLEENLKICPKCGYCMRMRATERIRMLVDRAADGFPDFKPVSGSLVSLDPLGFDDPKAAHSPAGKPGKSRTSYAAKIQHERKKTGQSDAVVCGTGKIGGFPVVLVVMDFEFMGGSMGSVVGEEVTRAIELATETRDPIVIVASSGGARMQEGILSLMQMAKTSAAFARLHRADVPALSVLCDPTTGGVTASFATLGDVLIAEPRALIAFAGPRVIEQTIRQKLPEGFQQSEFLLKHGMIDCIVERKDLKAQIEKFLKFFPDRPKTQAG